MIVEDADDHTTEHIDGAEVAPDRRVVQLQAGQLRADRRRATTARGPAASTSSSSSTSRPTARRTATRRMTTIRSRGASATTVAARGTRAWATRRPRSPRPTTSSTSSAASRTPAGQPRVRRSTRTCRRGVMATADPKTGKAPLPGRVLGQRRGSGGPDAHVPWDFGDGSTSLRQNPDHTLHGAGHVRRQGDGDRREGRTGTATVQIVVNNPPGNARRTSRRRPTRRRATRRWRCSSPPTRRIPTGIRSRYTWDFGDGGTARLRPTRATRTPRPASTPPRSR